MSSRRTSCPGVAGHRLSNWDDHHIQEPRTDERRPSDQEHQIRQCEAFPLPSVALDVLLGHRRNQENGGRVETADKNLNLVFRDRNGDHYKPDQMSSRIAEIARRLGYSGIGIHSMRHTHASQLLSRGVPIPTVSKRLGHANPSITLRLYAHALESDELIAAKRWDDAFSNLVKSDTTTDVGYRGNENEYSAKRYIL